MRRRDFLQKSALVVAGYLSGGLMGRPLSALGEDARLMVSLSPDRSGSVPLHGATLPGGSVFIWLDGATHNPTAVHFYQDDALFSKDAAAPWDLAGTNADHTAMPYNTNQLGDGSHTIMAQMNRAGRPVGQTMAMFTKGVISSEPEPEPSSAPESPDGTFDNIVTGQVAGFTVPAGQSWKIDGLVQSTANVIVYGTLVMRPDDTLRFVGVKENSFVGGGMEPLGSDVGLWIMGAGKLDAGGTPKLAWARATDSVPLGAASFTLDAEPVGWRVGDEVVIVPTGAVSDSDHYLRYDRVRVTGINGRVVSFSPGTGSAHPRVSIPSSTHTPALTMTAEILNITRDVIIEGTPEGRSHVFVHSSEPQIIRHVELRHMGPRRADGTADGAPVLGRYALHFHMVADGSRGSLVEGTAAHDLGNNAFQPHGSHGITFRNCVAHDLLGVGYIWDTPDGSHEHDSNDITWERCVASLGRQSDEGEFQLAGFLLGSDRGNRCIGCVAVGVQGSKNSSGFKWPASVPAGRGVWEFRDCVAHNNKRAGWFVWQNDGSTVHPISRFIAYHNGYSGAIHGAYRNSYVVEDSIFYGNGQKQFEMHLAGGNTFRRCLFDGANRGDYAFERVAGVLPIANPHLIENCAFRGYAIAALRDKSGKNASKVDLRNCSFSGNEFWFDSDTNEGSYWRVLGALPSGRGDGSIALKRYNQTGGTPVAAWSAKMYDIAPF